MRITQGAFSFLPDLTDEEIRAQIEYCLDQEWAVSIEYTDDPHPRNTYWEMWGQPMFDLKDPAGVMGELAECREANPNYYIRINAFDATHGVEIGRPVVHRAPPCHGAGLPARARGGPGTQRSATRQTSYAVDRDARGERYGA